MSKSANVYARIEPELKKEAESILSELGISVSNAITIFYKQIVLKNGLPFEVKLSNNHFDLSKMSSQEIDEELEKGYQDILEGKIISIDKAFKEIHKDLNLWIIKCF